MRINKPVTNVEYLLSDHQTIVSATDLKGNITYANPYFVEASGYSHEELIGAPQNILRHPDMPAAAFGDLWKTIKAGRAWTALVKNRRKNGDFYWVIANVTPVIEGGKPVGYMSVRTKPTREQIAAADALYKSAAKGRSLKLRQGLVMRAGILGWRDRLAGAPLGTKASVALSLILLATGVLGIHAVWPEALGLSRGWLGGLAAAAALTTVAFWAFVVSAIVAPLRQALNATQAMAGGDMTRMVKTDRTDETGQLLRMLSQMNINLRSIIGDVRSNFAQMQNATHELAAGNQDLAGRTDSQAATLEETAASMEQLSSTVRQNSDRASRGHDMTRETIRIAEKGGVAMEEVLGAISEMSEASGKISDIIGIIEGIASQTNLLALNAAVEAARAGDAGRGFAVVASEVRHLAQRTAQAAMEIKHLIDASVASVGAGAVKAQEAGQTVKNVVGAVRRVTDIMGELSTASAEQSEGVEQVNLAVSQMDDVTQQNASLVQQAAQATSDLDRRAQVLMAALAVFKLGKRASAAA